MADNWIHRARSNTLQKRLLSDLEKGIFTDVIFRVGPERNQRIFKAHKLVLASENSEFEKIINESDMLEPIKIPDVHPKAFENLIWYCYGGDFLIKDLECIRETCYAAKKFKANKLHLIAENNLINLLKSESLIKVLEVCLELNLSRAKEKCLEAISSRLEKVLRTEEFISAPLEIVEAILSLCPDHGLDLKATAICVLLVWADRHGCPKTVFRRLLSLLQYGNFPSDVVWLYFKRKLIEFKFQVNDQTWLQMKNILTVSTEVAGEAPFKDIKAESSEVEKKTSLEGEKVFNDEVEESGLKDTREIGLCVVNTEETPRKEETISCASSDSEEDYGVIEEGIIKDIIKDCSDLIKCNVADSSRETADSLIKAIVELTNHAAESMQEAIDKMENSFQHLNPCRVNTSENTVSSS